MGEETYGNKPLATGNYENWPGLSEVVNDERRIYHQWVNGSELFCYDGGTEALNQVLKKFSEIKTDRLEVCLLPGRGKAATLKNTNVEFDWKVSINGGIAAGMADLDKGANIWALHPILTIRVTDKFDLDSLLIPDNISVLQAPDLTKRYLECLSSTDKTVRGWSCGHLLPLAKLDPTITREVGNLLADEEPWVQLNVLRVLPQLENPGQFEARLEKLTTNGSDQVKVEARATLQAIRTETINGSSTQVASETAQQKKETRETRLKEIAQFCEERK